MVFDQYKLASESTIYKVNLGASNDWIKRWINEIYRLGDTQNSKTNVKALMTNWWIWEDSNIFNNLLDNIIRTLRINLPLDPKIYDLKLIDCWGAIYKEGDYTISHTHYPSNLSFVYYLTDSSQTPLIFSKSNFTIFPKINELIIFPGEMFHEVPKHTGDDRIVIAGNANIYAHSQLCIHKNYTLKR